ncbi:MAG: hypothetical protein J5I93_15000 [Pirellulaceae bacterium]|nr:hypothetical protein [Pirellulaceae bacterium]
MSETWLKPNRRALLVALVPPAALVVAGGGLAAAVRGHSTAAFWLGLLLAAVGLLGTLGLILLLRLPRLAFADGCLLVYLRGWQPERVPIELVEVFFAGQGPSMMPRVRGQDPESTSEVATIVVRLAESAPEWAQRRVNRSLGHWCEGYITIRGTWCEPLSPALILELNRRLVQAHRQQRAAKDSARQMADLRSEDGR